MFSIKVVGKNDYYTVYEASAYSVNETQEKLRSVSFWTDGGGKEPGLIIVDGENTMVVYIMNANGKTIDVVNPLRQAG